MIVSFFSSEWILPLPKLTNTEIIYQKEDLEKYPDGGSLHYILEYRNLSTIVSNFESNGFTETEDLIVSNHMSSIYWQKIYLEGMALSDPARPGIQSIKIPLAFIQSIAVKNDAFLTAGQWGIHYNLLRPAPKKNNDDEKSAEIIEPQNGVWLSAAFPVLGPSWMPPHTFDREPAQDWGAEEKTRKFFPSGDISGYTFVPGNNAEILLAAGEILYYRRNFIQMNSDEESYRATGLVRYTFDKKDEITFLYQAQKRDNAGIEFFLDEGNTKSTSTHAVFLSGTHLWKTWNKTWQFKSGFNLKYREESFHSDFLKRTLEDEINQYSPIHPMANGASASWENNLSIYQNDERFLLQPDYYNIKLTLDYIHKKESYPSDRTGLYYAQTPAYLTVYDPSIWQEYTIFHFFPEINWQKERDKLNIEAAIGVLFEAAPELYRLDSAFRINGRHRTTNRFHLLFGASHDPIPITSREVDFLDQNYLSGVTYFWDDINGNGIPENGEYDNLRNATGSDYHSKKSDLKMPTVEKVQLGFQVPMKNAKHYQFLITGAYYRNLLTVEMDENAGVTYEPITSTLVPGAVLYNRTDTNQGKEKYLLANQNDPTFLVGLETQLIKDNDSNSPWFYEFTLGAYYSEAVPPMGTGPFYNDIGYYSETTTDPNKTLTNWARPDYDRAYVLHLMAGRSFARYWKLSGILRYRDGEPIGYYQIADGLNQGPTSVQSWYRSKPDMGMPRLTYAMSLDIRLSYIRKKSGNKLAAYLDVYNILNSKTEIREYLIENDNRRDPLETNMERSLRLRIEYGF